MTTSQPNISFSGSIPANYDAHLGPMFFEPFAKDTIARVKKLNPQSVLEVACGTGRVTKELAAALPNVKIVATDLNPAMLDFAKKEVQAANVRYEVADAVTLPFEDNSFDCVVSQFGVMFYSDRPKAYAEALRVLKPGGTFIFNAWDKIQNNPAARLTDEALTHFFPVDTPAFYKVPFSYFDETVIRNDLAGAGFKTITIDTVKLTGRITSAANAAKGLLEGTPVYTAITERDAAQLPAITKHLTTEIESLLGTKDFNVPIQAKVATAVK